MNNGFVIVATKSVKFYEQAVLCANSLLGFYPEAKITLFTTKNLFNSIHGELFDQVNLDTPDEERGKIWGMANTPYDLTLYLDGDCVIQSEEIKQVFSNIKDYDMLWTAITEERSHAYNYTNGSPTNFGEGSVGVHGGVCLYKYTAKKFFMDWYKLDKKIRQREWWPDAEKYNPNFRQWDQFSLWWLMNKEWDKYKRYLTWGFFENDAKWNYLQSYDKSKIDLKGEEIVIFHYSGLMNG